MKNFAFYGTLRKGEFNYDRFFGDQAFEPKGSATVVGYKMVDLGMYPAVIPDPASSIFVEFYSIKHPKIAKFVTNMEKGAGYHAVQIPFNGEQFTLFVAGQGMKKFADIPTGDWVEYNTRKQAEYERVWSEFGDKVKSGTVTGDYVPSIEEAEAEKILIAELLASRDRGWYPPDSCSRS